MMYAKAQDDPYPIGLKVLIHKGVVVSPTQKKSDIFYIPLELRVDGEFIDHLDFRKVQNVGMLEQMLRNAIYNLGVRIDSKVRNVREAHAYAHAIEDGFRYAEEILEAGYSETRLPSLKQTFEALKSKYQI